MIKSKLDVQPLFQTDKDQNIENSKRTVLSYLKSKFQWKEKSNENEKYKTDCVKVRTHT